MGPLAFVADRLIALYQSAVAPLLPPACRYYPSCSRYTRQAIARFGFVPGLWLGALRLLRCHPWGGCGADPVPQHFRLFRRTRRQPNEECADHRQHDGSSHIGA